MKKLTGILFVFGLIFCFSNAVQAIDLFKECPKCKEINYKFDKEEDINFCYKCGEDLRKMKYSKRTERMLINEVLKRKIKDYGDPKKLTAADWYQRGNTSEDELTKMACFKLSLLVKENPKVHNNLGTIYRKKHLIEEAHEEFKKAVELDENYGIGQNNLATVLMDLGKFDESLKHIEKAIKIDPGNVVFIKNKGDILCGLKKYDKARKLYLQVLNKDKKSVAARMAAFKINLIDTLHKK